ncbi:transporter substrate-binding domain-containing protein [Oceanobacillus sp. CFH 90083]|uniref:transporter substrate-binding domain-containing protein n=1 Tax=Oceanobacillus sp. CFH 90083 TaxID=2592336 RepID=UPI00128B7586|nr:transporter substrate-binding domain-containing protein [Oceanobacillus sp. CFH 90083]
MKKLVLLLGSIVLLTALAACGGGADGSTEEANGDNRVLRAGSTAQSYPNGYEEDGKLVGYDVEVLEKVAENLGYEVEWVTTDFSGLMGQLETGRIDTVANFVAVTEERSEAYHFSVPYAYAGATIVTHEDNDFTDLEQFKGRTVSGVLGSNNIKNLEEFDPEIETRTYETRDGAMNDAINNRVDGYVNSRSALIAEIELGDLPLKFVGDPFVYEDISFPFQQNEEGEALRDEFNEEIENLREDGTLREISEKYFAGEDISVQE